MSKLIFILSSMRSGSTLLKALLGTRADISHLPEVEFNRAVDFLNTKPITVIKRPAFYGSLPYPVLPKIPAKNLILIRNPYDTITSLQKMNSEIYPDRTHELNDEQFLLRYWIDVYRNIHQRIDLNSENTMIVRYEDLIKDSIAMTHKIFTFVGCHDTSGTDQYTAPDDFKWEWGKDDGGEAIKSLIVQDIERRKHNGVLNDLIQNSKESKMLLSQYGY